MKKNILDTQLVLLENNNKTIAKLEQINEELKEYGLIITKKDAQEIVLARNKILIKTGRVEFNGSVMDKIVRKFAASPYIDKNNSTDTFCSLVEIFYEYKSETFEAVSDDELIDAMYEYFNGSCEGSLELLEGRELYKVAENIRMGRKNPFDITEKEEEDEE